MFVNDLWRSLTVRVEEHCTRVRFVVFLDVSVTQRELEGCLVWGLATELAGARLDGRVNSAADRAKSLSVGLRDDQANGVLRGTALDRFGFPHVRIRDPACGSGGMLLKFAKVLGKENVKEGFFGQEINLTTRNLAVINMFLHDLNFEKFDIAHGDTLLDPVHTDIEPFEAIVSNPPYSVRWEGDANPLLINDPRFAPAGVLAPKSKADLAFTMHILHWLAENGTAAIVEFPGVLYRGGAEAKIRKYLIDGNYVSAVIQLPPDLFFGTTIGTCIIVLKKSKKDNKTLFIDGSALFERSGSKNTITEQHRAKILGALAQREDVAYFAQLVDNSVIAENDYNLSVSSYVEAEDTREVVDIVALNAEIEQIVARQAVLRTEIDAIVAELESGK